MEIEKSDNLLFLFGPEECAEDGQQISGLQLGKITSAHEINADGGDHRGGPDDKMWFLSQKQDGQYGSDDHIQSCKET